MSGWAVAGLAAAAWLPLAAAVCILLAAGRRNADRQDEHRARALQARKHAASWGRDTPARTRPGRHQR